MHDSEHNRKVAISRWSKVLALEKANIPQTTDALQKKAALCGFLAGDGCVWKRPIRDVFQYRVDFFPDDKIMLNTYCDFLKELYNKSPRILVERNHSDVRITSRTIYEDLNIVASFGINKWKPSWSLFKIQGAKEAWLKAFFSAEAYVGEKSIKIQTINDEGMRDVVKMLFDLGIECKSYTYSPKNKKHSQVYIIFINKKSMRKRFADKIGFWHSKKTNSLNKSLGL